MLLSNYDFPLKDNNASYLNNSKRSRIHFKHVNSYYKTFSFLKRTSMSSGNPDQLEEFENDSIYN